MNHNKNRSMIFYAAVNMAAAALTVFTDITFRVCKQFTFTAMPLYVLSIAVPIAGSSLLYIKILMQIQETIMDISYLKQMRLFQEFLNFQN